MSAFSSNLFRFHYDVAVVGAGPAGAMAAITLAQKGARVVLLEKQKLPRYKVCGGGVLARAKSLLPADLQFPIEREIYSAELNLLDTGHHFSVRRDFPVVYMTMRPEFDASLVQYAQSKGVVVRDECEVTGIDPEPQGIIVRTAQGPINARFLVAADGAKSIVVKKLGLFDSRYLIPAVEWEIEVDDSTFNRFSQTARFDYDAVAHGYGWIFPKKNHLSGGLLTVQRGRFPLKKATQDYIHRFIEPAAIRRVESHGYVIPVAPLAGPLVTRRTILVGDAAGLVDPLTAEGITHAILSGKLAAEAIIDGAYDELAVARHYGNSVREQILKELRLARWLANGLYLKPWFRRPVMNWFGQAFCDAMMNVISGRRTYQELLLNPTKYFKLMKRLNRQATNERSRVNAE